MKQARVTLIAAAIGLTVVGLFAVTARRAESQELGRKSALIERPEELRPDYPIVPITPIAPATVNDGSFQLVGFTESIHAGNRGILNLTMACQEMFESSRICTAQEIAETVSIPEALADGHAWVRASEPDVRNEKDCRGWTSESPQVKGMAISLGPCTACFGGFHLRGCDELLRVACCARVF